MTRLSEAVIDTALSIQNVRNQTEDEATQCKLKDAEKKLMDALEIVSEIESRQIAVA